MTDFAVRLDNVSKSFSLPHEKTTSIKGALITLARRRRSIERQQVLRNVSLSVRKGEFVGIVGRNGSGKSTLLKLLAGIYVPDSGTAEVNGSLTPFIELGVGFNPELTGKENVFLNGALLGFSRKQMMLMYDEIVEFAELGRFMDQKLKNYSSGMQVRLAFSIAIKIDSDILLLDEVLAVGDAAFQKKCFNFFRKLKKDKKTVIFISHDMNAVREYCDRAILIEGGKVVAEGSADSVAKRYTRLFVESEHSAAAERKRWGSGAVTITKVSVQVDAHSVNIATTYRCNQNTDNPVFGISITSPVGVKIFESNTKWKKMHTGNFAKGESTTLDWQIPNIFTNGVNYITAAVADSDAVDFFDWWEDAASFTIDKDDITTAVTLTDHNIGVRT